MSNAIANSGEIRVGHLPQLGSIQNAASSFTSTCNLEDAVQPTSAAHDGRYGSCPVITSRGDACSNYASLRHSHKHSTFTATTSWRSQRYLSPKHKLCSLWQLSFLTAGHYPATQNGLRQYEEASDRWADVTIMTTWSTVLTSCGWRSLVSGIEMRDCSRVLHPKTPEKQF